jgi:AraC-like DNA-binding protein
MKPIFEKINKPEDQSFYLEEVTKPYFPDPWHFHPEIEILYVREGHGIKYVGDSISPFFPGDLVIIGSDTPHVWSCSSDYLNMENNLISSAICIQFMEDILEKSLSDIPEFHKIQTFLNDSKRGMHFENGTRNLLIQRIEELPGLMGMRRFIGLLTILDIMSTSSEVKYLSSPNYKPVIINAEEKDRMEIIYRYVIQNYSNKIFLDEIASIVNLTPQSFCRFFKSRTTKVFSSFVNEIRIGNSCKNLIENKYTISQVCFQSGFNYLSNFNRQFKRIKGMTPSEFQHKFKNHNFELTADN